MKTPEEYLTRGKGSFINCTDYDDAIQAMKDYAAEAIKSYAKNINDRFIVPTDRQMVDFAILFNDGKLDRKKLADMVAYAQFIIDRLHENGDILEPSSKEVTP